MNSRRNFFLCAVAALSLTPMLVQAGSGEKGGAPELRLQAALVGPKINNMLPSGKGDFRKQVGRARLNVQVEDVNLEVGTVLDVLLDNVKIGTITTNSITLGGEIEFNSQDGDLVPEVKKGSVVLIQNAGTTIMSGVF